VTDDDLWRRELPRHANGVWNGYLEHAGDLSGLSLLPLFLHAAPEARQGVQLAMT
jgi:aminoglycoside phosphotransferase family enzyme